MPLTLGQKQEIFAGLLPQLITRAYERVLDKAIVTYDFARQMFASTEVSTSGFAKALVDELKLLRPIEAPAVRGVTHPIPLP